MEERDNKLVIVVGIPGVGKTTVITKSNEILTKKGNSAAIVVFGTLMFDEAKKLGITNRDQLRKLSLNEQQKLQSLVVERISQMREEIITVDTHLFIKTSSGYYPGLPFELAKKLNPTNLILIIADPSEVINRRTSDQTRSRDQITIQEVKDEISLSISMISTLSIISGAPFKIIKNDAGLSEEAANRIVEILGKK